MPIKARNKKSTAAFKKAIKRGPSASSDVAGKDVAYRTYRPTNAVIERRNEVYKNLTYMIDERGKTRPHFNGSLGDRTAQQYWDDSDKRLNGYTPTREEQDKESWQANVFNPVTRQKLKAIVASVALQVPEQEYTAVNKEGLYSTRRAEFIKQMVKHSRNISNPELDIFFEAWGCAGKGTMIKYDGYLKSKQKRKFISSFDQTTGEIEFKEREVIVDDKPIDLEVPLNELYIWDFKIFDIQDQLELQWVKNYNKEDLEAEFSHYQNYKYVKDKASVAKFQTTQTAYFYEQWSSRVGDNEEYEVIRRYNKKKDLYEIWINGVEILSAPLLWGRRNKLYPFSKTIFEPFIDKQFFYGASLPGVLEGNQDIDNTVWNSILDKMYRSLKPPMLVGLANKDLMDLEDELVDEDNKIYVPDINQVKPFPYESVSNADMAMLNVVSRMLDMSSVDANQSGIQGKGVTAREILVADEHAKKLKGIFFMFLQDLWVQKTRLRIENVIMNYMQVKKEAVIGKDGAKVFEEITTIYNVKNVDLSDGSRGTLGIQVVSSKEKLPPVNDIVAREDAMNKEGINYKMIAVTADYLDDWMFDFVVTTDSVFSADKIRKGAEVSEKHSTIAQYFPEYFVANKEKLFAETVDVYGENIQDYKKPAPPAPAPVAQPGPQAQVEPLQQGAEALAGAGMGQQ